MIFAIQLIGKMSGDKANKGFPKFDKGLIVVIFIHFK